MSCPPIPVQFGRAEILAMSKPLSPSRSLRKKQPTSRRGAPARKREKERHNALLYGKIINIELSSDGSQGEKILTKSPQMEPPSVTGEINAVSVRI